MSGAADDKRRSAVPKYLAILALVLFVTAAIAGIYSYGLLGTGKSTGSTTTTSASTTVCASAPVATDQKVAITSFGGITEYNFAENRTPSGITVAPDGSVWFGEWGLPGVAHLYPNGTLMEYRWPYSYSSDQSFCGQATQIWSVALWNGSVWGTDLLYNRLVAVNPATGGTRLIDLANGSEPYTLTTGPNGTLWFTELGFPDVGKVSQSGGAVTLYPLPMGKYWETVFMAFKNSTLGYVMSLDDYDPEYATLFSFNPQLASPTFTVVSNTTSLYAPTGFALGEGGLWATEHSASAMAFLNFTTGQWTLYPTSTVPYTPWVLTYFDASNGTAVWFNEHYGNRMGVIYNGGTELLEYNVSNPPLYNLTTITDPTGGINMVTMALAQDGAWFAAAGGFVGYVNGSYVPPFSISTSTSRVELAPGGTTQLTLDLTGALKADNLTLQFSDNEFNNGSAKLITFSPSTPVTGSSGSTSQLTISASGNATPGVYVAAATITDGSIYRSVYFTVVVTGSSNASAG